ncbi:MAG: AraC family transcriptional regulator ligand-binding domain-containing protein [Ilumatobacter sp.]
MSSVPARAMIWASERDDVRDLLVGVGLDPDGGAPSMIEVEPFYAVLEDVIGDGDHDLVFRYARLLEIDSFGAMGLAFKTASSVRAALERAERYVALIGDVVRYELVVDAGGGGAFVVSGRPAYRPGVAVANEGAIAAFLSVCRQVVEEGLTLTPRAVSFAHSTSPSFDAASAYFRCPVRYGQDIDALHFDAATLNSPTRLGDEALSGYLLDRLDDELRVTLAERGIEARVRHAVANGLADGVPPMRVVAGRLAMSERTLHRRLGDEGLRYQDLVVEVRRTVATALLTTTDHSLVDVAFLTGFSDQSAFQRAFKRGTGRTPMAVRRGGSI